MQPMILDVFEQHLTIYIVVVFWLNLLAPPHFHLQLNLVKSFQKCVRLLNNADCLFIKKTKNESLTKERS